MLMKLIVSKSDPKSSVVDPYIIGLPSPIFAESSHIAFDLSYVLMEQILSYFPCPAVVKKYSK